MVEPVLSKQVFSASRKLVSAKHVRCSSHSLAFRSAQSGFTLVEVLIALAILAIALPALMVNISAQINGFGHMRDKSAAHWVAMNKMTELRLQNEYRQHLPKDRQRGDVELMGRDWYWEIDTEQTENKQLLQVTVQVRDSNDSDVNPVASVMNYFVLPVVPNAN